MRIAFGSPSPDPIVDDRFWTAFITDAIEANGLTYGGGQEGFVTPEIGSATEGDRDIVLAWLSARSELSAVIVGPLVDAWYDDPEDQSLSPA